LEYIALLLTKGSRGVASLHLAQLRVDILEYLSSGGKLNYCGVFL